MGKERGECGIGGIYTLGVYGYPTQLHTVITSKSLLLTEGSTADV